MTHTTHVRRTAIVTGAARGTGAAAAGHLAGDDVVRQTHPADRHEPPRPAPADGPGTGI